MADPFDGDAGIAVDALFELKDDQHAIGDAAHRFHASRPPGPELRADVVHDRDAQPAQRPGEDEVEIRKVDRDEDVGALRARVPDEPPVHAVRARQDPRNLEQPGDG